MPSLYRTSDETILTAVNRSICPHLGVIMFRTAGAKPRKLRGRRDFVNLRFLGPIFDVATILTVSILQLWLQLHLISLPLRRFYVETKVGRAGYRVMPWANANSGRNQSFKTPRDDISPEQIKLIYQRIPDSSNRRLFKLFEAITARVKALEDYNLAHSHPER